MIGYIYVIKNRVNNKVYIGQTRTSLGQRWKEHLRDIKRSDQLLYRAMRKYGVENFYIEQLDVCDVDMLDELEISYIKELKSTSHKFGYNVSLGGKTPKLMQKEIDEGLVIDLYCNKNKNLSEISKQVGISRYRITSVLKNHNIVINDRHTANRRYSKLNRDDIEKALKTFGSLRKAAKSLNIKYCTFRKACMYYNIEYNLATSVRHQETDENIC